MWRYEPKRFADLIDHDPNRLTQIRIVANYQRAFISVSMRVVNEPWNQTYVGTFPYTTKRAAESPRWPLGPADKAAGEVGLQW